MSSHEGHKGRKGGREDELAKIILDAVLMVQSKLRPGLLESGCKVGPRPRMAKTGLFVERQKSGPCDLCVSPLESETN